MNPRFQYNGVITVGTNDPNQQINLDSPTGYVKFCTVDQENQQLIIEIVADDGLNTVCRRYTMSLDSQAYTDFMVHFFAPHVRRISKVSYPEFAQLLEVQNG